MCILNRMLVLFWNVDNYLPSSTATGAPSQSVAIDVNATMKQVPGEKSKLLEMLYKWAFDFYKTLTDMMQFSGVTTQGVKFELSNFDASKGDGVMNDFQIEWHSLWDLVKTFFESIEVFTIPIATLFFVIAIYRSVITKPADAQAKELVVNIVRYVAILVISLHLFDIVEWLTRLTEQITLSFYAGHKETNKEFFIKSLNIINAALDAYKPPSLSNLFSGDIGVFFENLFVYVLYFLFALLTLSVFVASGFSMLMATINRIVKPLLMAPFSAIVLGIGACSGEGERMLWRFARNYIGLCLSGVFIIIALRFAPILETINLFDLNLIAGESQVSKAIMAVLSINLPVVFTAGLVKSADTFMGKIF